MKTYQKFAAGLLLLATTLGFGCGKQDNINLPKLMPKSEYSNYFENKGFIEEKFTAEKTASYLNAVGQVDSNGDLYVIFKKDGMRIHLKNLGNGKYKLIESTKTSELPSIHYSEINMGDMNGDGLDDLLVAGPTTSRIHEINYIGNNGNGDYTDQGVIAKIKKLPNTEGLSLFVKDHDGDGAPDLLIYSNRKTIFIQNNLSAKNK